MYNFVDTMLKMSYKRARFKPVEPCLRPALVSKVNGFFFIVMKIHRMVRCNSLLRGF